MIFSMRIDLLKETLPSIYSVARFKEGSFAEWLEVYIGETRWSIPLLDNLNDQGVNCFVV